MEWINDPTLESGDADARNTCVIRICPDKASCHDYGCIFLMCSNNA